MNDKLIEAAELYEKSTKLREEHFDATRKLDDLLLSGEFSVTDLADLTGNSRDAFYQMTMRARKTRKLSRPLGGGQQFLKTLAKKG